MPQAAISAYLERLPQMQAEQKLLIYEAVRTPHLNGKAQARVLRAWRRQLGGNADQQVRPATRAILQAAGIRVEVPE